MEKSYNLDIGDYESDFIQETEYDWGIHFYLKAIKEILNTELNIIHSFFHYEKHNKKEINRNISNYFYNHIPELLLNELLKDFSENESFFLCYFAIPIDIYNNLINTRIDEWDFELILSKLLRGKSVFRNGSFREIKNFEKIVVYDFAISRDDLLELSDFMSIYAMSKIEEKRILETCNKYYGIKLYYTTYQKIKNRDIYDYLNPKLGHLLKELEAVNKETAAHLFGNSFWNRFSFKIKNIFNEIYDISIKAYPIRNTDISLENFFDFSDCSKILDNLTIDWNSIETEFSIDMLSERGRYCFNFIENNGGLDESWDLEITKRKLPKDLLVDEYGNPIEIISHTLQLMMKSLSLKDKEIIYEYYFRQGELKRIRLYDVFSWTLFCNGKPEKAVFFDYIFFLRSGQFNLHKIIRYILSVKSEKKYKKIDYWNLSKGKYSKEETKDFHIIRHLEGYHFNFHDDLDNKLKKFSNAITTDISNQDEINSIIESANYTINHMIDDHESVNILKNFIHRISTFHEEVVIYYLKISNILKALDYLEIHRNTMFNLMVSSIDINLDYVKNIVTKMVFVNKNKIRSSVKDYNLFNDLSTVITQKKLIVNTPKHPENEFTKVSETLIKMLSEIDTVLVFFEHNNRLMVFECTNQGIKNIPIEIKANNLKRKIETYKVIIKKHIITQESQKQALELSKSFHELILKNCESLEKCKNLYLIPYGIFHELPFESIIVNGQLFSVLYRISYEINLSRIINNIDKKLLLSHIGYIVNPTKDLPKSVDDIKNINNPIIEYSNIFIDRDKIFTIFDSLDILHLGTHGIFYKDEVLLSGLLLGKNVLYTCFDILFKKFNKLKVVVLGACSTAKGEIVKGGDYMGVVSSFLSSGVNAVIAARWDIDDTASSIFFSNFYKYFLNGKSLQESLEQSRSDIMKDKNFSSPLYWAGWSLYGNGNIFYKDVL
ncbi:MAG: CHAT domain-containing protein [Leptospiraceae bacterium]|nr:CHAT domain-containing protein [Leptospiraceae bacterium]